ncbi:MAG: hypothetical protein JJ971_11195 [Balneolaceae bacterium]|nr:hypothetical protein [Balneolaceae bacterium]MBO6546186.1 hypothetical protein [Balneolaceae bacterium]MBO6648545.1 hypothetical protein [Balneolaceae bacterium]
MKWFKDILQKEEGSALATVLIISVIISLFISSILSGILLQSRFIQREVNSFNALYAAEEGVYRFLNKYSFTENFQNNQKVIVSNGTEVDIAASPFGGFIDIQSKATVSGQSRTIRVLAGSQNLSLSEQAIALGDSTSALKVTGTTTIEGSIITYGRGIQTESFRGILFSGNLTGDRHYFNKEIAFPAFDLSLFELQQDHFRLLVEDQRLRKFSSEYNGRNNDQAMQGDTLYFDGNTEWVTNQRVQFPTDLYIIVNGNFTINGDYQFSPFSKLIVRDTLLVGGTVSGKNILMYAGKSLQIGGGASLSAQLMSEGNIIIRDEAYLQYPSLVYSSKEFYEGGTEQVINIKDQSVVDGTVIYPIQTNSFTRDLFRVKIDTNATVRGSIYTQGQTELLGTVLGSVNTHQFYFYYDGTSYINWLKDITVDVKQRPENFVLPIGFSDSTRYELLDWYEMDK